MAGVVGTAVLAGLWLRGWPGLERRVPCVSRQVGMPVRAGAQVRGLLSTAFGRAGLSADLPCDWRRKESCQKGVEAQG